MNIRPNSEPIPGYLVEERLGAGQFGEVWRARSPGNTYVALKFLQLSGKHGWKEFRAVQRVKAIRHANLMPIIAIWLLDEDDKVISDDVIENIARNADESNGEVALQATLLAEPVSQSRRPAQMIIANLLANQSLGDRLKESQAAGLAGIPVDELLGYMDDAAKGLDFLNSSRHKIGETQGAVQHCDVKPDNIMLTGGSAVVTDFGVAQLAEVGSGATATSMGGTPAYMAPECFDGKTSNSTDQYALAITYYQLRTGCLPFEKETYGAVYETHKTGTHDFSAVPPREQAVLRKATSPNPERRYSSCVELVNQLHDAVGPLKPRQSRKKMVAAAVAVALAVVAAAFMMPGSSGGSVGSEAAIEKLQKGYYSEAVGFAETLSSVDQMEKVLQAFQAKLADQQAELTEGTLPNADFLAANIRLIGFLRTTAFATTINQGVFNDVSQRVEADLDKWLEPIRAACDNWNPSDEQESPPADLLDQIVDLNQLLCTDSTKGVRVAECLVRQPALELQKIRIEARDNRAEWPNLRTRLESVRRDEVPAQDAPYVDALAFILSGDVAERFTRPQIEQRLDAYRDFQQKLNPEALAALAAWEQRQIDAQMHVMDEAIDPVWLTDAADRTLGDLVRAFPKLLPKSAAAATDPIALSIKIARQHRKGMQFEIARNQFELTRTLGNPSADHLRQIADELLILDLLDPATPPAVIHKLLAELQEGDFETWGRIAEQIHDEYSLAAFGEIDRNAIAIERAALVEALRLECRWSNVRLKQYSEVDWEPLGEALAQTPYVDYGHYVRSLGLWHSAKNLDGDDEYQQAQRFSEASAEVQSAFADQLTDSLLTAPFRRKRAGNILDATVADWIKGHKPADAHFGASDLFDGKADKAFGILLLARTLGKPYPSRDALLLAAAVAAWDSVQDEHAADLFAVAEGLLNGGESDATVQALRGTIECAAFKARAANRAADLDLVRSAASALTHLYLDQRLGDSGNGSRPVDERLKKIKSNLLDPVLPAADRLWEARASAPLDDDGVAALGIVFRAAGFLFGEPAIADDVRYIDLKYPDDLVFDYLHRANEVAPDSVALIAQGRALEHVTTRPDNWLDVLNALAERAVELAPSDGTPAARGRAYALKAYARLLRARDVQSAVAQRHADRAESLQLVDQARQLLDGMSGELRSDFADCLVTRAAINIEYVYFGNLSFEERKAHLLAACEDAKEASEIEGRRNPEYAFAAWGSALEDLAHYVHDAPPANFNAACIRFADAIRVSKPSEGLLSLGFANHLPAHKNLLRCRVRQATSGALALERDDRDLLSRAISEVLQEFPALEPDEANSVGVDAKRAGDIAELLFWISEAEKKLAAAEMKRAAQDPTADNSALIARSSALIKDADVALDRAVQWSRRSRMWENWAQYQYKNAEAKLAAGQAEAAAAACLEVINAEQEIGARLSYLQLYNASMLLQLCMASQKNPWTDADWDDALNQFPPNEPLAAPYLAKMRIRRLNVQNNWSDAKVSEIDALISNLDAIGAKSDEVAMLRLAWLTYQVPWIDQLLAAEKQKNNVPGFVRIYQDFAAETSAALVEVDALLPEELNDSLDRLKSDIRIWSNAKELTRWQKTKLREHLASTFTARSLIAQAVASVIQASAVPPAPALRNQGREALMLSLPEVAKEFLTPAAFTDWDGRYRQLRDIISPIGR